MRIVPLCRNLLLFGILTIPSAIGLQDWPSVRTAKGRIAVLQQLPIPRTQILYCDLKNLQQTELGRALLGHLEYLLLDYLNNEGGYEGYWSFKTGAAIEPFQKADAVMAVGVGGAFVGVLEGEFEPRRFHSYFQRIAQDPAWQMESRQVSGTTLYVERDWWEIAMVSPRLILFGNQGFVSAALKGGFSTGNADEASAGEALTHWDYEALMESIEFTDQLFYASKRFGQSGETSEALIDATSLQVGEDVRIAIQSTFSGEQLLRTAFDSVQKDLKEERIPPAFDLLMELLEEPRNPASPVDPLLEAGLASLRAELVEHSQLSRKEMTLTFLTRLSGRHLKNIFRTPRPPEG